MSKAPIWFGVIFSSIVIIVCIANQISTISPFAVNPGYHIALVSKEIVENQSISPPLWQIIKNKIINASIQSPGQIFYQDVFSRSGNGQLFPKHPILASVLGSIGWFFGGPFGLIILNFLIATTVLFSFQSYSASEFKVKKHHFIFLILLSSELVPSFYGFSYDLIGVMFIALGFFSAPFSPLLALFFGSLSGMIRITQLIFLPFIAVRYLGDSKRMVESFIGASVGILLILTVNLIMWGDPFTFSYLRIPYFIDGQEVILQTHSYSFSNFISNLQKETNLSDFIYFLITHPILIFAPLALFYRDLWPFLFGGIIGCVAMLGYSHFFSLFTALRMTLTPVILLTVASTAALLRALNKNDINKREDIKKT